MLFLLPICQNTTNLTADQLPQQESWHGITNLSHLFNNSPPWFKFFKCGTSGWRHSSALLLRHLNQIQTMSELVKWHNFSSHVCWIILCRYFLKLHNSWTHHISYEVKHYINMLGSFIVNKIITLLSFACLRKVLQLHSIPPTLLLTLVTI